MSIDPSSLRADARDNYNRLIEATEVILSRERTISSLESIARLAGVGIGTLYRHFPTRKDLLEAVYADKINELVAKAQKLISTNSPEQALSRWLQSTLEYSTEYGGFADLMALEARDKSSSLVSAGSELLANAQKTDALRADVSIFDVLQLLNGIISSDAGADSLIKKDKLLSVVMSGLKA